MTPHRAVEPGTPPTAERSGRVIQAMLVGVGVVFFAWALLDPRFRDKEQILTGRACLPLSFAAAAWIGAWLQARSLRMVAAWMMLAAAGQGVALQLIEAGHSTRYQHYLPLERFSLPWNTAMLAGLAVQTALVLYGLVKIRPIRLPWPRCPREFALAIFILLLSVGYSAAPSRDVLNYAFELLFASFVQVVSLGNILLAAAAIPADALSRFRSAWDRLVGTATGARAEDGDHEGAEPGAIDRFALLAACWVTVVAAALSYWCYERHPHVPDEVVYLLHARYFADGRLSLPMPPVLDAFRLDLLYYDVNRVYSPVSPGWPAMLAVGVLFGVPWLVNPALAGINVLLAYVVVRELASRRTARLVILLLAVSPWHLLMAMSFMTHTASMMWGLIGALGVARARRAGSAAWALGAGAAVGMLSLIRPLDGVIGAVALGAWSIAGARRMRASALLALVIGTAAVGTTIFPYNKYLTGDPTWFPVMKYFDEYFGKNSNALGFGPERGGTTNWALDPFPGHGPADAAVNTVLNLSSLNEDLFGWSIGSLLLLVLYAVSGLARRRDWAMYAIVGFVIGIYALYWYGGGPGFGGRYWFLALTPLVLLGARASLALDPVIGARMGDGEGRSGRLTAALVAMSVIVLTVYLPWRAIDKFYRFRGMRPDVRVLAERYDFGRSLVLVRGLATPDYASAATYNPLDLNASTTVYAWDRDPSTRAQVLDAYSDRPVWLMNGPSITGRGFEVVAGPLSVAKVRTLPR